MLIPATPFCGDDEMDGSELICMQASALPIRAWSSLQRGASAAKRAGHDSNLTAGGGGSAASHHRPHIPPGQRQACACPGTRYLYFQVWIPR